MIKIEYTDIKVGDCFVRIVTALLKYLLQNWGDSLY